ncbi:MAG: DNA polymerase/3'-5' exonuclease PolX [Candidatus Zhuqueibacterota bacterium]
MKNSALAEIFEQMADILELQGELGFKVNAYRRAARVIQDLQEDITILWENQKLHELPGIGDAFVRKISEYLATGKMSKFESLKQEVPSELIALLKIQNLGPKTIATAHKSLGVNNLDDLVRVIENGQLAGLPKMGEKKMENIKKGIEYLLKSQERISIAVALPMVEGIISQLTAMCAVEAITCAGSVRRMKETVHDVDILAVSSQSQRLIETFLNLPGVGRVDAGGTTRASVHFENGVQVDLRVIPSESFGAALQYFTGSQAHNVKLRGLAKKNFLKINEYGIFKDDKIIGGSKELDIYEALGLQWIPPELREDRGEIERAASKSLPALLEIQDVRGDLHVHSNYSDGKSSIAEIVNAARLRGYHYLAICDHSVSAGYARGLNRERLLQQMAEIAAINKAHDDVVVLQGIEVDILGDGSLDIADEFLPRLDFIVASIHSGFKTNPTERIIKAMENPFVDVIGHPTGRIISRREGYEVDLNAVFDAAEKTGTALEINAHPDRLDLSDVHAKRASERGIRIAINSDSHECANLDFMKYGVAVARRGWLNREAVLNTWPIEKVITWRRARIANRT